MTAPIQREEINFRRYEALGNIQWLRATYTTQSFPRHTHNEFVVGFIESGAEKFDYRRNKHIVSKGNLFVVSPGEVHTGQAVDAKGWTYRTLYIDSKLLQKVTCETTEYDRVPSFPNLILQDRRLAKSFLELHLALEKMDSLLECESQLLNFLEYLTTSYGDIRQSVQLFGKESQLVRQVCEYIEAHYAEKILLDDLARLTNLSKFHLLRAFSLETGRPPHVYQEQIRINRAKVLLLQGCRTTQTATETGYVDQSHFTRRFKRFVGVTPWQFARDQQ